MVGCLSCGVAAFVLVPRRQALQRPHTQPDVIGFKGYILKYNTSQPVLTHAGQGKGGSALQIPIQSRGNMLHRMGFYCSAQLAKLPKGVNKITKLMHTCG